MIHGLKAVANGNKQLAEYNQGIVATTFRSWRKNVVDGFSQKEKSPGLDKKTAIAGSSRSKNKIITGLGHK